MKKIILTITILAIIAIISSTVSEQKKTDDLLEQLRNKSYGSSYITKHSEYSENY